MSLLLAAAQAACGGASRHVAPPTNSKVVARERGQASWYGKRYQGRSTASGEPFDRFAMTAAHKKLAFGTWVRVTNLVNQHQIVVRINDRGPYIKGRMIDLSEHAAELLKMKRAGVVPVLVEVLAPL